MEQADARRAVAAAIANAAELDLAVDDTVVLNDSNRLVIRLMPCDVVARVTPMTHFASAEREVEIVRWLVATDSPVVALDARVQPRVFVRDGFKITMWTYVEPVQRTPSPTEYAHALGRLHAGLRKIDVPTDHCMDRVAATASDIASRDVTPDLTDGDRAFLAGTLRDLAHAIAGRNAAEQLVHGEPHPWNMLMTADGPLFIDFENACRGPVEYDLAWVPDEVCRNYPGADQALIGEFRGIVLAIIAAHRWSRDDHHPSGRESGVAFLDAVRDGPPWPAIDEVHF